MIDFRKQMCMLDIEVTPSLNPDTICHLALQMYCILDIMDKISIVLSMIVNPRPKVRAKLY